MGKKRSLSVITCKCKCKVQDLCREGWEERNGRIDGTIKGDVTSGVAEWVSLHWI